MSTKWDSNGYAAILNRAKEAESAYRDAYSRIHQQDVENFLSGVKKYGISTSAVEKYRQQITEGYKKVHTLVQNMQAHQKEYEAALEQGKQNIENQAMHVQSYGWIDTAAVFATSGGLGWSFAQSGKSFSRDYNDLSSFMATDEYKAAMQKAGVAQWSNTALILDTFLPGLGLNSTNEYIDGLLEGAMSGILDGLSEDAINVTWDGSLDYLGTMIGIEDMDNWISEIKGCLETYGSWNDVTQSREYKEALAAVQDEEMRKLFGDTLKELLTSEEAKAALQLAEGIGQFTDVLEMGDLCVDIAVRVLNDYSKQVGYLDAMEEGLLQAGFANGPVLEKIDEMRRNYSDSVSYALDKTCDYLLKEAKNGVIGAGIKQASSVIPTIKNVTLGLKVISGGAKIGWSDEISAYNGIAGLSQYDQCLTVAYENYAQMIRDGVATEQDVAQADNLFELLRATKIKEYGYMIELTSDTEKIKEYQSKIEELENDGSGRF